MTASFESISDNFADAQGLPEWSTEQGTLFEVQDVTERAVIVPLAKLTEVPNGQKMVPVAVPQDFDKEVFKRTLAAAFQVYLETANLNQERIAQISAVPEPLVKALFQTEEFNYALACRGVQISQAGITPQQDYALMILGDVGSNKTWGARLKEAGISQATFMAWLQEPYFAKRWRELSEKLVSQSELSLVQLMQQVGNGNMRAIELALEVSGRHDRQQIANLNVTILMNRILEIIARNLAEQPDKIRAIANEFRQLGQEINLNSNALIAGRVIEGRMDEGVEF